MSGSFPDDSLVSDVLTGSKGSVTDEFDGLEQQEHADPPMVTLENAFERSLQGAVRYPQAHSSVSLPSVETVDDVVDPRDISPVVSSPPARLVWLTWIGNLVMILGLVALVWAIWYFFVRPPSNAQARFLEIPLEGRAVLGTKGPVVAVFSDYYCPHCREFERSTGPDLHRDARAGHLRLVKVQYPYISPESLVLSRRMACLERRDQPSFWRLDSEILMASQGRVIDDSFFAHRLDPLLWSAVLACANGPEGQKLVERDRGYASEVGVQGTPYVSIDGRPAGKR